MPFQDMPDERILSRIFRVSCLLERVGHIPYDGLDFIVTEIKGGHGGTAIADGVRDFLIHIALPELGMVKIHGLCAQGRCCRPVPFAICPMTDLAFLLVKGFSLIILPTAGSGKSQKPASQEHYGKNDHTYTFHSDFLLS